MHAASTIYIIRLQMIKVSIAMFYQILQLGLGFLLNLIGSLNLAGSPSLVEEFDRT
jgi:hypothetical protein